MTKRYASDKTRTYVKKLETKRQITATSFENHESPSVRTLALVYLQGSPDHSFELFRLRCADQALPRFH